MKAAHTERPLTEEERVFAEVHHELIYRYMRLHQLDENEWYDILTIPYLNAVKKYHQYEALRSLKFEQIFFRTLDNARSNYFRDINRKKRCPAGGFVSLDFILQDQRSKLEELIEDTQADVEEQVLFMERFEEFYNRCDMEVFYAMRMDSENIKLRKVIEKQKYKKNREIFRKIFGI